MVKDESPGNEDTIFLIGAGRLGRALLYSYGDKISFVHTSKSDVELDEYFPERSFQTVKTFDEVNPEAYNILWLAIPDAAIRDVSLKLARNRVDWTGCRVIHSAGSLGIEPLRPLYEAGATPYALHPNDIVNGDEEIAGSVVWGVTTIEPEHEWVLALLDKHDNFVSVSEEMRGLYHAAASHAANYGMVHNAVGVELYKRAGIASDKARIIVHNFTRKGNELMNGEGLIDRLTGPIVRGDIETVEEHLQLISEFSPLFLQLTCEFIEITVRFVGREDIHRWENLLGKYRGKSHGDVG